MGIAAAIPPAGLVHSYMRPGGIAPELDQRRLAWSLVSTVNRLARPIALELNSHTETTLPFQVEVPAAAAADTRIIFKMSGRRL
jgi:hypothetical protein